MGGCCSTDDSLPDTNIEDVKSEYFNECNAAITINETGNIITIEGNNDKYKSEPRIALGKLCLQKSDTKRDITEYVWKVKIISTNDESISIGLTNMKTNGFQNTTEINTYQSNGECQYMTITSSTAKGKTAVDKPRYTAGDVITVKLNVKYWIVEFLKNDEFVDKKRIKNELLNFTVLTYTGNNTTNTGIELIKFEKNEKKENKVTKGYTLNDKSEIFIIWDKFLAFNESNGDFGISITGKINELDDETITWKKVGNDYEWEKTLDMSLNSFYEKMGKYDQQQIRGYIRDDGVKDPLLVDILCDTQFLLPLVK